MWELTSGILCVFAIPEGEDIKDSLAGIIEGCVQMKVLIVCCPGSLLTG